MLVKCRACGEKVDRLLAYKVVIDGKNHYYCTEKEYQDLLIQKEYKDNTYQLINQIFGRIITNTILFKEIGEISKIYTYEKILAYLKESKTYLHNVMKKDFSSEYAQIRYFSAILKNSLTDFQIQTEAPVRQVEVDVPNCKFSRKTKRKPLIEYEEEAGGLN